MGNLNEIDRRAYRHNVADGLTEIAMALFFLVPVFTLNNPAFSWMIILPVLLMGPWLKRIRARTTYPRIGFVEPKAENPGTLFRGMAIYVVIVLLAVAAGVVLWSGQLTSESLRRVAPLFASILFGGGLLYAAGRSGLLRYYVFLVTSVVLGVALTIFPAGGGYSSVQIYMLAMGVLILGVGLITYARFVKNNPYRDDPEGDRGC